jgi:putative ABC transport system substrate-binding protein
MTLAKLVSKARLPAIYGQREFVDAGGLMSYATNVGDLYHRSAGYVDKILKGAKPSELPIQQMSRFELIIDLRLARELGIDVPRELLVRADRVIK